jgi:DNA-binding PucR family transcriptional regulator
MLTVRDIVALPNLDLEVVAGAAGLEREVSWIHVSELEDPTPWLEGGELLVTTGRGLGSTAAERRAYVCTLAAHGLAGLALGVGLGYDEIPQELSDEGDRLSFPVLAVPYRTPFIAITKAAASELASERLARLEHALAVHEQLAAAVLDGRGVQALLGILCTHVGCSASLVDERGRLLGEQHAGPRLDFEDALELPVVAGRELATLRVEKADAELDEEDRRVLHHGQTALAFELSRRRAVSAAELRLAGDLVDDLVSGRLDEHEVARRLAAFGLDPSGLHAGLLAAATVDEPVDATRHAVAAELDALAVSHLSASRPDRAAFVVAAADEEELLELATTLSARLTQTRIAIGRPVSARDLGRSLLEARAALDGSTSQVATYRELGSLELLLGLPSAALEAFVDRVLAGAATREQLVDSLTALLDSGCRWSDAAASLGIHRHTLRYRMEQLRRETGRHPDDPAQRMELWLAVRAREALAARELAGAAS